jgi:hypothetical protein
MIFVQSVNAEAVKYLPGSAMISTPEGKCLSNFSFITLAISLKRIISSLKPGKPPPIY